MSMKRKVFIDDGDKREAATAPGDGSFAALIKVCVRFVRVFAHPPSPGYYG